MELGHLIELQMIDYKIRDLASSIGDLPGQVDRLKNKSDTLVQDIEQINVTLTDLKKDKVRVENDTKTLYAKLKKYQEQVYAVTTNKEYDAISLEMENTESTIETNETKILELLEDEDKLKIKINEMESLSVNMKNELKEKDHLLKEKLALTKDRLIALETERRALTDKLKKPILATYERIRKARNGVALSEIKNHTCGECFANIPAQTAVEVRKMDTIRLCETCGRILISTNHKELL